MGAGDEFAGGLRTGLARSATASDSAGPPRELARRGPADRHQLARGAQRCDLVAVPQQWRPAPARVLAAFARTVHRPIRDIVATPSHADYDVLLELHARRRSRRLAAIAAQQATSTRLTLAEALAEMIIDELRWLRMRGRAPGTGDY